MTPAAALDLVALVAALVLLVQAARSARRLSTVLAPALLTIALGAASWAAGSAVTPASTGWSTVQALAAVQIAGAWAVVVGAGWLALLISYRAHLVSAALLVASCSPAAAMVALVYLPAGRDLVFVGRTAPDGVVWGPVFWSAAAAAGAVTGAIALVAVSVALSVVPAQRRYALGVLLSVLPAALAWAFFVADPTGRRLAVLAPLLLCVAVTGWLRTAVRRPALAQLPITVARVLREVDGGVAVFDATGGLLYGNAPAAALLAAAAAHPVVGPDGLSPGIATTWTASDGTVLEVVAELPADPRRAPTVVVAARDVTEVTRLREHLQDAAFRDPMTGARNRRYLDMMLAGAAARPDPLSVIALDVDHFKQVNDTFGHAMGDRVLIAVVEEVGASLPPGGEVVRTGGDEFTVVLPGCDGDRAEHVAISIAHRCSELPFSDLRGWTSISVSTGVAELVPPMTSDELLLAADRALYVAKAHRPQLVVPTPRPPSVVPRTRRR